MLKSNLSLCVGLFSISIFNDKAFNAKLSIAVIVIPVLPFLTLSFSLVLNLEVISSKAFIPALKN